jgi:hypothetical protein
MNERLKLKMPSGPDEDLPIDTIPVMMAAVDAVLTLAELVAAEGAVSGLALVIGSAAAVAGFPVAIGAAFFGNFLALGSGYAEAWEVIRADRTAMGYSYGVVMACDNRPASLVASYFWEHHPEYGYDFVDGGVKAQNAFNVGLVTGYWQGYELLGWQKRLIWRDILTRTGKIGTISKEAVQQWNGRQWKNWYMEMGIAFRRFHVWH